jgi:trans-aconitate methyltransferase
VEAGVAHWDGVYERSASTSVSWYQPEPTVSTELITAAGVDPGDPIVDVGGGASTLVDRLLDDGYRDVTVLDIAAHALRTARERLGERADRVRWVTADLLNWQPPRRYRLWHDRAVFHFLTDTEERERYRAVLRRALAPGGRLIVATFADDGPQRCSGLPTARYSPADLAAEFSDYRVLHTAREEHHTPSGGVQPFTWLLLTAGDE